MATAEAPKWRSPQVRFEGLSELSLDDAKNEMCLPSHRCLDERPLDRDLLERDELVLQSNLYDHGYIASKLEPTLVKDTPDGTEFVFRVIEGPRFRVSAIHVQEVAPAPKAAPKVAVPPVHTKAGDWFSRRRLFDDHRRIERVFRDAGYGKVDVRPQIDLDTEHGEVAVRIDITRGMPITIARVRTTNAPSGAVLERCTQIGLLPGSLFNESRLEALKSALQASHPDVAIAILDVEGQPDQVEVSVEVP